ncbi:MAG: aminoacyl-tRNA hydrolase [Treponema sp.]|jgi:PTH1 family peptidyl-tRNA hydrolase|nr:aminoacyl-tRNA hydrolase [Treponema sp.]
MLDLVVFLGNPGREYERNRHNAAWLFAECLPFSASLLWREKFKGFYACLESGLVDGYSSAGGPVGESPPAVPESEAAHGGPPRKPPSRKLHFLKPKTFMNVSGEAAAAAAAFFKIAAESILVVHDELELPLGTVSLKRGGGLGGHNGLRSMKLSLGTADFWRFRFGIGRPDDRAPGQGGAPGSGKGIVDWVLSDFSAAEEAVLDRVFALAVDAFTAALTGEPAALLPAWGKRPLADF